MILFEDQCVWSYTGLAQIGQYRTDEWLTKRLQRTRKLQVALDTVRTDATAAFRSMSLPVRDPQQRLVIKRTAFICAGFALFPSPQTGRVLYPYVAVVSNYYAGGGRWHPTALRAFDVHLHMLRPGYKFLLSEAPARLSSRQRRSLVRDVRHALEHSVGPESIARILCEQIQGIAAYNPTVGANVMCMVIPRDRRPITGTYTFRSAPVPLHPGSSSIDRFRTSKDAIDQPRFIYVPGDNRELIAYGPVVVYDGSVMGGLLFGPTPLIEIETLRAPRASPFPPYELRAPAHQK